MELNFRDSSGQRFSLSARPTETIGQVRARVAENRAVPVESIILIYGTKSLRDIATVQSCNIKKNGYVFCLIQGAHASRSDTQTPSSPPALSSSTQGAAPPPITDHAVEDLQNLGFSEANARFALDAANNNVSRAAFLLTFDDDFRACSAYFEMGSQPPVHNQRVDRPNDVDEARPPSQIRYEPRSKPQTEIDDPPESSSHPRRIAARTTSSPAERFRRFSAGIVSRRTKQSEAVSASASKSQSAEVRDARSAKGLKHVRVVQPQVSPAAPQSSQDEIYVAVMGVTGSGKSTLISHVDKSVHVGHGIVSDTQAVSVHRMQYDENVIVHLLDTPGFDDSYKGDTAILEEIASFLEVNYRNEVKLNGIIYLHRINDIRMTGSSMRSLSLFKKLMGEDAWKNTILATTMWEKEDQRVAEKREQSLITGSAFWALMIKRGAQVRRHKNTPESVRELLKPFVERRQSKVVLSIQKELVDEQKDLVDTGAGQHAAKELQRVQQEMRQELSELKTLHADAIKARERDVASIYQDQVVKTQQRVRELQEKTLNLRTDMQQQLSKRNAAHERAIAKLSRENAELEAKLKADAARQQETKLNTKRRLVLSRKYMDAHDECFTFDGSTNLPYNGPKHEWVSRYSEPRTTYH